VKSPTASVLLRSSDGAFVRDARLTGCWGALLH